MKSLVISFSGSVILGFGYILEMFQFIFQAILSDLGFEMGNVIFEPFS